MPQTSLVELTAHLQAPFPRLRDPNSKGMVVERGGLEKRGGKEGKGRKQGRGREFLLCPRKKKKTWRVCYSALIFC